MTGKVVPFPAPEDQRLHEEADIVRRINAGDPQAMEDWLNHEVTLPFGVVKRYGDLNRTELEWLIEEGDRKESHAAAEIEGALDEIEYRAIEGDNDAIALWNEPDILAARAEREARRRTP